MKKTRLKAKWKWCLLIIILILIFGCSLQVIKNFNSNDKEIKEVDKKTTTKIKEETKKKAKLTLVGDFLFESPFYKAISNGYEKNRYFSLVKHYFEEDDLSIGNMEVVIGNDTMNISGDGYNFCAPSYVGDLVNTLDLQVLSTANNHVYDRGIEGINSTLDYFKNNTNIMTVGTYKDYSEREKDHILEINGIKFGFLAYTYGTNIRVDQQYRQLVGLYRNPETKTMDEEYKNILTTEITNLRNKVDVLIVMMHWEMNLLLLPIVIKLKWLTF